VCFVAGAAAAVFVMEGIHSHVVLRKRELVGWLVNYYYVFGGVGWWWCVRGRLVGGGLAIRTSGGC
jgi:hypothetical protein